MRLIPLVPRTDMVELRGKYEELMRRDFYEAGGFKDAYVHITLTDEEEISDWLSDEIGFCHNGFELVE